MQTVHHASIKDTVPLGVFNTAMQTPHTADQFTVQTSVYVRWNKAESQCNPTNCQCASNLLFFLQTAPWLRYINIRFHKSTLPPMRADSLCRWSVCEFVPYSMRNVTWGKYRPRIWCPRTSTCKGRDLCRICGPGHWARVRDVLNQAPEASPTSRRPIEQRQVKKLNTADYGVSYFRTYFH